MRWRSLIGADESARVRAAAARHPSADPGLLSRFVIDECPAVREAAARRPLIPIPALSSLASDPDSRVRRALAAREHLPESLRAILLFDPDLRVRNIAARQHTTGTAAAPLETTASPPGDLQPVHRAGITFGARGAAGMDAMPDVLITYPEAKYGRSRSYSGATDPGPNAIVIEKRGGRFTFKESLPAEVLDLLARHPWAEVRLAVAGSRGVSRAALYQLAGDPEPEVQMIAVANPATPAELQREVLQQTLFRALRSNALLVRALALTHPTTPVAHLARSARSLEWLHRWLVAIHPSAPDLVLRMLLDDGNWLVRSAAEIAVQSHDWGRPKIGDGEGTPS